ncbi:hypothetical protein HI914_07558 [Erysiphe necator]|nr:hypothetical protein HI914_07558 [Erysiphe necator]
MLMRKRGKLDDQEPGKARLILPPRTLTTRPPETTACGIPLRWVPLSILIQVIDLFKPNIYYISVIKVAKPKQ